jgi:hypothetical protein
VLLIVVLPSLLLSQTFSGRLTTAFYAFERNDTTGATSGHVRGYQSFQFDFGKENIAFRTYGQLDNDLSTRLAGDGKVRMYNFFLDWKNIGKRAELRIGRQPIFAGVATGTVDGVQIKMRLSNRLRLKGFGGGLLPSNQRLKLIDDLDKNYMAGGQINYSPTADATVSLSYFNKLQKRTGYNALRADSIGNVLPQFIEPSNQAFEFASLDASWNLKKTSFYGRADYDVNDGQLSRAEISIRGEAARSFTLSGSYTFRSPRLPWNSIFAAFDVEDNHEVEAGIYYRYKPSLRFYGNAAGIFYSGDESLRFTLGTECNYGGVNVVHRSGYAGNLNGINASAYYPLRGDKIMPSVQLSWASYKLEADQSDSETLFSGAAGVMLRPWNLLTIDGQLQYLHNRFYSNDMRFLLRLQYWFFTKFDRPL